MEEVVFRVEAQEATAMGKNILIFADGTGNEGGLLPDESRTNVYKLFRASRVDPESTIDPETQIAFYISGIGTPTPGHTSRWQKIKNKVEQMFGNGLSQKIAECYVCIISVWRPGDRIYLFGFSRGAYTVRCLAHVLEMAGIPTKQKNGSGISLDPKKLYPIARSAVRILYHFGLTTKNVEARDKQGLEFRAMHGSLDAVPYFIGVWETVAAMGLARFMPHRYDEHLTKGTPFIRHAMAIDEFRSDFIRVNWGGSGTMPQGTPGEPFPFLQVWFAGNHSDIGGSYPEN